MIARVPQRIPRHRPRNLHRVSPQDIVSGHFDAGIRIEEHIEKDMIAVRVSGRLRPYVVGSPPTSHRIRRLKLWQTFRSTIAFGFAIRTAA